MRNVLYSLIKKLLLLLLAWFGLLGVGVGGLCFVVVVAAAPAAAV